MYFKNLPSKIAAVVCHIGKVRIFKLGADAGSAALMQQDEIGNNDKHVSSSKRELRQSTKWQVRA